MANTITDQKPSQTEIKAWWAPAFTIAAVIIFAISGWGWWHFVRSDPSRTFYAALENSMQTGGVTRQVKQDSGGQTLNQDVRLNAGTQHVAHGATTIAQTGDVTANIKTEAISTPREDYVRYTQIETTQKGQDGKKLDFSKLINVWGKAAEGQSQAAGELYNESVLGVVPVGNVPAGARKEIMQFIHDKDVYSLDNKKIKQDIVGGRPVYTYEVKVSPENYIGMLKKFGKAVGLKQLEAVDPASYKNTEPLTFQLKVDVWGRHLTGIAFSGGERTERLSGYGIRADKVAMPQGAIPLEELQSRLQAIQ